MIRDDLDGLRYSQVEDEFELWLNDTCPELHIGNTFYPYGYALRQIDPVAFYEGCSEWEYGEFEEIDGLYYRKQEVEEWRELHANND